MRNQKSEPTQVTTDGRQCYNDNNINTTERELAGQFQPPSGGEFIAPKELPTSTAARTPRTEFSLAYRQRNGRCINCAD